MGFRVYWVYGSGLRLRQGLAKGLGLKVGIGL